VRWSITPPRSRPSCLDARKGASGTDGVRLDDLRRLGPLNLRPIGAIARTNQGINLASLVRF